ncbi:MAG TPA: phosphoribosylanthranilate isomerase [Dehalococcoidia bacterium]|jgi:phosphoribosylanthranilate isomerase|nr:phosphoribosylanthranilate isomerase [Dehalococcoidia bacterium]
MTRVKICGIKEEAHALVAAEAGADFIGLVFAPSPRQVTLAQAERIARVVKESHPATEVVGLFVNASATEVNTTADLCHLDWVQLSGDEPWEYCLEIAKPLIKVVHISEHRNPQEIGDILAYGASILNKQKHIYLIDSFTKGKYGGTGKAFNWELARQAAKQFPVIIAGGLTPENVAQAIKTASPWGVDVSSGVEISGTKHPARIRAFIQAVRRADDEQR